MPTAFHRIALLAKPGDPAVGETLERLVRILQAHDATLLFDESTCSYLRLASDSGLPRETLGAEADLAIVVGGDGTLLQAGRSLVRHEVPLLGINLGRLGFLADVSPEDLDTELDAILAGDYTQEARSLVHATVWRDGQAVSESCAVNDVVVHKWDIARMIELEVRIDDRLLNTQRSDGLIVSTPTGSTAYALSGGGPLLEPDLRAILLVPICPHSLSNRPIVLGEGAHIEIRLHGGGYTQAQVTWDGQVNFALVPGDRIRVQALPQRLRLIHPAGYDYYDILRQKFLWGLHS